jgi:hypothetical protein
VADCPVELVGARVIDIDIGTARVNIAQMNQFRVAGAVLNGDKGFPSGTLQAYLILASAQSG